MPSKQTLLPITFFFYTSLVYRNNSSLVIVSKREAILFLFGYSEVNSTWLITSEPPNQRAREVLITCVVYTKIF